ncbi:methyl-accepting chemotaxis protein [Marasmitruncus massiliensis]|uniref:methyl-accepting chemotaxis protein n=1 Tax=Marasmitruncus massiliensis TaxID=1944642 RepID=UPI000C7A4F2E|nr:methyl-accepting chemotaxis protein [Marasmitruncus massiliensis]
MKNLKIGKKLFVTFGIVILLFAASAVSGLFCIGILSSNFTTFYHGPYTVATESIQMRANIQEAEKYLIKSCTSTDPETTKDYIDKCQAAIDRLNDGIAVLRENYTGNKQLIEDFSTTTGEAAPIREKIFQLAANNQNDEAMKAYNQEYEPVLISARDLLSQIEQDCADDASGFYAQGSSMQQFAFILLLLLSAVSLIFIILVCLYIVRSITKPIHEIELAANKMANGDLNVAISYQSKDELGSLSGSIREMVAILRSYVANISEVLGRMAEGDMTPTIHLDYAGDFAPIKSSMQRILRALNDTLSQIALTSDQITSGSGQVSDGAQTLSQGSTEQASSIEELSATINEISGQIRQNAQNAQQSDKMVLETVAEIEHGNQQMSRLVEAMNDISGTSGEIGKIIKTIDDIAFQTNILALNAAVEAARAGAAGKGFAVVADEVRNLAGKSAQAAKNTTLLIENAIHAVKNGTQIADETAQSLNEIVSKARDVSLLVNEIAKASNQQADAVIQTTLGVEQISAVVQNNSATAEESAAASEELDGQAQILKKLAGKFKLLHTRTDTGISADKHSVSADKQPGKYTLVADNSIGSAE